MIFSYLQNMQSHPSWVCGLKQHTEQIMLYVSLSHPSWVCGLKRLLGDYHSSLCCHTLRGCVD